MIDIKILKSLFNLTSIEILNIMEAFLQKHYKEVIRKDEYLFAKGTIPIVVCAHSDKVFSKNPYTCYDPEVKILYSITEGMGADDRAGIYAIIKLIEDGYRPHVVITDGEEKGCKGAAKLCKDYPKLFSDAHFVIQLDRRGEKDCVFYDCGNIEFVKFIESFGFETALGSFTDIVKFCPNWDIAGVNLSVGYYNEHTDKEFLIIPQLENTIEKVKNILNAETIQYKFIEIPRNYYFGLPKSHQCALCNIPVEAEEFMYATKENGELAPICLNCLSSPEIKWCFRCGNPYFSSKNDNVCFDCKEELMNGR